MSDFEYHVEYNLQPYIDEVVDRINRRIDEESLKKVERQLADYGYVKVVRCLDCAKWHWFDTKGGVRYGECDEWRRADSYCVPATREDGFCYWAKPKKEDA